jgi:hypothetical protein
MNTSAGQIDGAKREPFLNRPFVVVAENRRIR